MFSGPRIRKRNLFYDIATSKLMLSEQVVYKGADDCPSDGQKSDAKNTIRSQDRHTTRDERMDQGATGGENAAVSC